MTNSKLQAPKLKQYQMIKIPSAKTPLTRQLSVLVFDSLAIGIYLGFGIWDLGF